MIELIRTYMGFGRLEGRIKQTFNYAYRCSKCESIADTIKELRQSGCTHELKTTPPAKPKNKV